MDAQQQRIEFPYFFVGTFIEAVMRLPSFTKPAISLLFRRDFH